MAYINVSSEGYRASPLGVKKAEQDLIKRRYKQALLSNKLMQHQNYLQEGRNSP
jgi:hypothetical protein